MSMIQKGLSWWFSGKKPPAISETWVGSLGQEDSLVRETSAYSSILA